MKSRVTIFSLSVLLLFVLLGGPQIATAQQSAATALQTTDSTAQAQAPLPDAPSTILLAQNSQTQPAQPAPQKDQNKGQSKDKDQNPLGAATAQQGVTAGGAASRPAGAAIAPAKQRQMRSFLIKLGAIAAGGAAIGTVIALTRGTSPVPPGSGR